jgi:hypothetical protein
MLATASRRITSYDAQMLAMADRLFDDYSGVPIRAVFRAVGAARSTLREAGEVRPAPEVVERLARTFLDEDLATLLDARRG